MTLHLKETLERFIRFKLQFPEHQRCKTASCFMIFCVKLCFNKNRYNLKKSIKAKVRNDGSLEGSTFEFTFQNGIPL